MDEANKLYQVVISDRAVGLLLRHVHFVAQVNVQAAERLREEIMEAAKSLQRFPERNMWLCDPMLPVSKYRKMLVSKRYLLVYQIKDDTVLIEYLLDCRQDYQWLLEDKRGSVGKGNVRDFVGRFFISERVKALSKAGKL